MLRDDLVEGTAFALLLTDLVCTHCRAGVDRRSNSHALQRTRYTVDFHKAPFTGLGLTFAPDPETGEVLHLGFPSPSL